MGDAASLRAVDIARSFVPAPTRPAYAYATTAGHDADDRADAELVATEALPAAPQQAPSAATPLAGEPELVAELIAPVEGGAAAGHARKELALRVRFERLGVADSRTLAARLRRNAGDDVLARAFTRLIPGRRQRLLAFLDDAPRRRAIRREAAAPIASDAPVARSAPTTYDDMLAAVLEAQRLTDGDHREFALRCLQPVEVRLGQLQGTAFEKLSHTGAGNIAGHAVFDSACGAVSSWIRKLKLGSSIATAPYVIRFRAGAETIRLVTGERNAAPTLAAFDHATRLVGVGAAALLASPAVLALAIEEGGLAAVAGREGASDVALWALHHPAAALAISEVLAGVGFGVADQGVDGLAAQLTSPLGCVFTLLQIAMDAMHVASALGTTPGARRPRPPVVPDTASDPALADTLPGLPRAGATVAPALDAKPTAANVIELPVQLADVEVLTRKSDIAWNVYVKARGNGGSVKLGDSWVFLDEDGSPPRGPALSIKKYIEIAGEPYKVEVYDGAKRLSLTDVVLDKVIAQFHADFGYQPASLPGQLIGANMRNFQRAYAEACRAGADDERASQLAIRAISYGRSRIARGYTRFAVHTTELRDVDLGAPLGIQRVPTSVEAHATKPP